MRLLGSLAERHIYFRLPYLQWFDRKVQGILESAMIKELGEYGDSDFLAAVSGKDQVAAWKVMDELMDTLQAVNRAERRFAARNPKRKRIALKAGKKEQALFFLLSILPAF